jgi:hypothetical protein
MSFLAIFSFKNPQVNPKTTNDPEDHRILIPAFRGALKLHCAGPG